MEDSRLDRIHVGGNITRSQIQFSFDEKFVFCASGSGVKVFCGKTGEQLGRLDSHTATVTAVILNPSNSLQLYTVSHDGFAKLWDFSECVCLASYDIGSPILQAVLCKESLYLNVNPKYYDATSPRARSCRVLSFNLTTKKLLLRYKSRACVGLCVSPKHDYVASIAKSTLTVWSVAQERKVKFNHVRCLTTVAFHPQDYLIATGDEQGQITLWYGCAPFTQIQAPPVFSSFHWHAHAVSALAFSEDGSYLLSGGKNYLEVYVCRGG